jgi:hypothetical protein
MLYLNLDLRDTGINIAMMKVKGIITKIIKDKNNEILKSIINGIG